MRNMLILFVVLLCNSISVESYSAEIRKMNIHESKLSDVKRTITLHTVGFPDLEYGNFYNATHILLTGPILKGDSTKVKNYIQNELNLKPKKDPVFIFMNSPGGSFYEGVALAEYFYEEAVRTIVWQDQFCFSACAIAFMGGHSVRHKLAGGPIRYLHAEGTLGFHAPYVNTSAGFTENEIDSALAALDVGFSSGLDAASILIDQSKRFSYSYELTQAALRIGPEHFYYIDTPSKFIDNYITRIGLNEELRNINEYTATQICKYWFRKNRKTGPTGARKISADLFEAVGHYAQNYPKCYVVRSAGKWVVGILNDNESIDINNLDFRFQEVNKFLASELKSVLDPEKYDNVRKRGSINVTQSGLRYEVIRDSDGPKPNRDDTVIVHYVGTLSNGYEFDSSIKRGIAAEFSLSDVILGWQEGLQLMSIGSKYRFVIPPELAYGEHGAGQIIRPGATLTFVVELLEIK